MGYLQDIFDVNALPLNMATVNGTTLAYRIAGAGEPLLLITGYGATMDMWAPETLRILAEKYRLILFDNRGIAHSSAGDAEFSIELFADDAAALLRYLGITRAQALGWSMGTFIAQELALKYPDLISKLALYSASPGTRDAVPAAPEVMTALTDSSGSLQERELRAFATLFPAEWLREHPNVAEFFPVPELAATPEIMQRQLSALLNWRGSFDRLTEIDVPVLLITGANDAVVPAENSRMLARYIRNSWLTQIDGGGHGLMYQYPRELAQAIVCFLDNAGQQSAISCV